MITRERLDQLIEFDPAVGGFLRKRRVGKSGGKWRCGARAGYLNKSGYRIICLDYKDYFEHNLVWFIFHGEWPSAGLEVDHRNRVKSDNQPDNLRLATRAQNNVNAKIRVTNKTGVKGVYFDKAKRRFAVQMRFNGKIHCLGRYKELSEATEVSRRAREQAWGEFTLT